MNLYAVSDYDIQALIDDELSHEEARQVQSYIEKNSGARRRYQELLSQKSLLKLWWKGRRQ